MRHMLLIALLGVSAVIGAGCPSSPETRPADEAEEPLVGQGEPCEDATCEDAYTCVEYYGIAGPSGPKFTSCEIPCVDDDSCPEGQKCVTIADGPGQVCRPAPAPE